MKSIGVLRCPWCQATMKRYGDGEFCKCNKCYRATDIFEAIQQQEKYKLEKIKRRNNNENLSKLSRSSQRS